MKQINILIPFLLFVFSSCDRSGIFEEHQSTTPYEYHVIVVSDDINKEPVEGVSVYLFGSKEDRNSFNNVLLEKKTNKEGKAIFQPSDLKNGKGFYYLAVDKGDFSELAESLYLMINDGHTNQWIKIQETLLRFKPEQVKSGSNETEPALGATIKFYATDKDRNDRTNAIESMTQTLTSGSVIDYRRSALEPIYKKNTFVSIEKVIDGNLYLAKFDLIIPFGSNTFSATLQPETLLRLQPELLIKDAEKAIPAIGAELKFYNTKDDRTNKVNEIISMRKILTSGSYLDYLRTDLDPIYNKAIFISAELDVDGISYSAILDVDKISGNKSFKITLKE